MIKNMTLSDFIELHKDSPFKEHIDIEMVIGSLTCNNKINLDNIIKIHNEFKKKSTIGKLKKEIRNELKNQMSFSIN